LRPSRNDTEMKPLSECLLYAFVDTAFLQGRAPELVAKQLCDGGADLIQLRAKHSSPEEIRRMAEKILPVTRAANVGLVINDHLEIARAVGADLCHLGQERAIEAGADYLAIGPVYATGTKPTAKPVTLDYVRWAAENVSVPWFAIGGINLQNLDEVLAAGARRICVVSAILNADDVAKACAEFQRLLL